MLLRLGERSICKCGRRCSRGLASHSQVVQRILPLRCAGALFAVGAYTRYTACCPAHGLSIVDWCYGVYNNGLVQSSLAVSERWISLAD